MAAIGAAVTAAITAAIAYANFSQTHTANQTADFANCMAAVSALADAQRRVTNASTPTQRAFEFNELLNLMEAMAGLHNDRKLTGSTKRIVEDFLDEAWARLSISPDTIALVASVITSPTTFIELSKFAKRPGSRVPEYVARFKKEMAVIGGQP